MNEELRGIKREMLQRLHLADFNARYHDALCRRFLNRDLALRMALAFFALVVFVVGRVWTDMSAVWQTLSGAIALISTTLLPLLKWNKLIPRIEAERLRWIQLKNEYENLWTDTKADGDWPSAQNELRKLRKKDKDAEKSGGVIPEHADLLDKARRDVIMARGGAV